MPRAGAIIFIKLDLLRVACDKRGRDGSHDLGRLIEKRGREAKLIDWPDELTADDPCGARCRDLARMLERSGGG
jgi:hypothetical protein